MSEIQVGIRDLKSRLSEYLRLVRQGNTVVITDYGQPVGRILPIEQSLDERLKSLVELGLVNWNGKKLIPQKPAVVNHSETQISDILVEMRE